MTTTHNAKPKLPPDFNARCGHYGGHLKEIPLPHIRMFGPHSSLKRRVTIKVRSWVGTTAIGAKHINVDFDIERNPIWNSTEGRWQECWDDEDAKKIPHVPSGRFIYGRNHEKNITTFVRRTVKKFFPPEKFNVCGEDWEPIERKTWVYKEGD